MVTVAGAAEKTKDAYWGFELQLDGLRPLLNLAVPGRVYYGRTGKLHVAVMVHEVAARKDAEGWRKERQGAVRHKKGISEVTVAGRRLLYKRTGLAGFVTRHGHAFFVRGPQCFELHLTADESVTGLRAALDSFKLRGSAPGTLLAYRIGRETGRKAEDPQVLLDAGIEYVSGTTYRMIIPELGAKVLGRARARMNETAYEPERLWLLYEFGGLAHAARPVDAFAWHRLAEGAAKGVPRGAERGRQSAYNAACAASRAGKLDEAFAALYRAFGGGKPVSDGHVSDDKDLENCRRDPRWHAFWREKVKGQ